MSQVADDTTSATSSETAKKTWILTVGETFQERLRLLLGEGSVLDGVVHSGGGVAKLDLPCGLVELPGVRRGPQPRRVFLVDTSRLDELVDPFEEPGPSLQPIVAITSVGHAADLINTVCLCLVLLYRQRRFV